MACTKKPYSTQLTALRALAAIRAAGKPGRQPVRAYPCQDCRHWHLTSKRLSGKRIPIWEHALSGRGISSGWGQSGATAGPS